MSIENVNIIACDFHTKSWYIVYMIIAYSSLSRFINAGFMLPHPAMPSSYPINKPERVGDGKKPGYSTVLSNTRPKR